MHIRIRSLGGSGEDCRSCFLIETPQGGILLDCGVRREWNAPLDRVYPLLTREIAAGLRAVFLSHAHEDHTAALPYLHELGYRGPMFATSETIGAVKGFLRKWVRYVEVNGGALPFSPDNIDRIDLRPIGLGCQQIASIPVMLGRSGHMKGSCWIRMDFGEKSVLYTGDLSYDGMLLSADPLPPAHTVIMECAYAGQTLIQQAQYAHLADSIRETLHAGGKVLLPVPPNGRGCDMLLYLKHRSLPLCTEPEVPESARNLRTADAWIRNTPLWHLLDEPILTVRDAAHRMQLISCDEPRVFLTPDGMLTSPTALAYYEALKDNPLNKIIITGHAAKGTIAHSIFVDEFRRCSGVRAHAERITLKVHPDQADALALLKGCGAQQAMLFHADAAACGQLLASGLPIVCGIGKDDTLIL